MYKKKDKMSNLNSLLENGYQDQMYGLCFQKIDITSKGDDYQILFTANPIKSRIVKKLSKITGIKITKIGKIISGRNKSKIINLKNKQIEAKNRGYIHQF